MKYVSGVRVFVSAQFKIVSSSTLIRQLFDIIHYIFHFIRSFVSYLLHYCFWFKGGLSFSSNSIVERLKPFVCCCDDHCEFLAKRCDLLSTFDPHPYTYTHTHLVCCFVTFFAAFFILEKLHLVLNKLETFLDFVSIRLLILFFCNLN